MKSLVAYFSCGGNTKKVAEALAEATGSELFEIAAKTPYTDADLDWNDKNSRSTLECGDPGFRPEMASHLENAEIYDRVYIGFPIWWYTAPPIIKSFLEENGFAGKTVSLFCTSGGSDMGDTVEKLRASAPDAVFSGAKRFDKRGFTGEALKAWAESV